MKQEVVAIEKGKLPEKWRVEKISKLIPDQLSGFACAINSMVKKDGYVQLRPFNIVENGKLNLDTLYQVPIETVNTGIYVLKKGDILFNNTNSTELVGKSVLVDNDYPYAFSNHINRLRVNTSIVIPAYFQYYLRYMWINGHFARNCKKWIGQAGYTINKLNEQLILLPPLEIQQKIVDKLDKQMAQIDIIKDEIKKQKQCLSTLFKSYLCEKFDGEFPTHALGSLIYDIKNGVYKAESFRGYGNKLVRMYNIENNSIKLNDSNLELIELTNGEKETYLLKKDDIIVSRVNSAELVGKCGIVKNLLVGCAFENMVIRLRVKPDLIIPDYLAYFLISQKGRHEILSITRHAINQSSINNKDMRKISVPIPPNLEVQKKIVDYLDNKFKCVENMYSQIEFELDAIENLKNSILNEVFDNIKFN